MKMPEQPQRDPIRAFQRKAIAARRVGENAQCACGEARAVALISGTNPIICAQCQRRSKGQNTLDKHHVAGRANSPVTIAVPVNDHRAELSTDQQDNWPPATLRNPDGLQTIKAAACIRGFLKMCDFLMDEFLRPLPELLEGLAKLEQDGTKGI
jgi:hypothetical protein